MAQELGKCSGGDMIIHALIACSKSKSVQTDMNLIWANETSLESWAKNWTGAVVRTPAKTLYTGDELKKQLAIIELHDKCHPYIISAGAGLIDSQRQIPSYESTFIGDIGPSYESWSNLPEGGLDKLNIGKGDLIVTFAPPQYHRALLEDPIFKKLAPRMVVASTSPLAPYAGHVVKTHPRSREVLGVASKGLHAEFFRIYLEEGEKGMENLYKMATSLPPAPDRRKVDDGELREHILNAPNDVKKSISRTVDYIRNECGISAINRRIRHILLEIRN